MKLICCGYLLLGALWDIWTRRLPGIYIWSGCIGMGIYALCQVIFEDRLPGDLLISLIPGFLCYLFARISHSIGEGDAWLILIMGFALPFYDLAKVLMLSLFLSGAGSILFLIITRRMENLKIPFVPFLFLATTIVLVG